MTSANAHKAETTTNVPEAEKTTKAYIPTNIPSTRAATTTNQPNTNKDIQAIQTRNIKAHQEDQVHQAHLVPTVGIETCQKSSVIDAKNSDT